MIKRCGRATALCGLLVVWGLQAEPVPFRQIHRVFGDAVTAEKLEAVRARYPRAFDDGIIVSTFVDTAIGSPSVKPFSAHRTFSEAFRGRGVSVQICLSTTIGHNDDWTADTAPKFSMPPQAGSPRSEKAIPFCCRRFPPGRRWPCA